MSVARRGDAHFETFPMYGVSGEKHTGSNEVTGGESAVRSGAAAQQLALPESLDKGVPSP